MMLKPCLPNLTLSEDLKSFTGTVQPQVPLPALGSARLAPALPPGTPQRKAVPPTLPATRPWK